MYVAALPAQERRAGRGARPAPAALHARARRLHAARRTRVLLRGAAPLGLALLASAAARADQKDIEYVAEHLPEVAMDNRYASLPVWRSSAAGRGALALGYSRTRSGELRLAGPMLSGSWTWRAQGTWTATAFAFLDELAFSGEGDLRPLRSVALPAVPLPLPAPARFDGGDGTLRHFGAGVAFATERDGPRLGPHRWVAGLQVERASLRGYGYRWQILAGPAAGTRGSIGFDADYDHLTPFAGLEFPRQFGRWTGAARAAGSAAATSRRVHADVGARLCAPGRHRQRRQRQALRRRLARARRRADARAERAEPRSRRDGDPGDARARGASRHRCQPAAERRLAILSAGVTARPTRRTGCAVVADSPP